MFQTPIVDHDSHFPLILHMLRLFLMRSRIDRYTATASCLFAFLVLLISIHLELPRQLNAIKDWAGVQGDISTFLSIPLLFPVNPHWSHRYMVSCCRNLIWSVGNFDKTQRTSQSLGLNHCVAAALPVLGGAGVGGHLFLNKDYSECAVGTLSSCRSGCQ